MRIIFDAEWPLASLANPISMMTDHAIIFLDTFHYDDKDQVVELKLKRRDIVGFKKAAFSSSEPKHSDSYVESLLIIKDVSTVALTKSVNFLASSFTCLFGIQFRDGSIYMGSVEESQGFQMCELHIQASKVNIELRDDL